MKLIIALVVPGLATLVAAQGYDYQRFGAGVASPAPNNGSETFRHAAITPDMAYSVNFDHDNQSPSSNWPWIASITNVSMANITQEFPDAQVAFVDYRLRWNGAISIESTVDYNQYGPTEPDNPSTVCTHFVYADFPADVFDRFDGSSGGWSWCSGL